MEKGIRNSFLDRSTNFIIDDKVTEEETLRELSIDFS